MTEEISAEDMAELIIDALVDARMVPAETVAEAVAIAAEEIRARQAVGNYIPALPSETRLHGAEDLS